MKNLTRKPIAIILAILVAAGGTGIGAYAAAESNTNRQAVSDNASKEEKTEEKKPEINVKDETVYILSEADGSVKKIIVSDWLKNASGSAELRDSSDLGDITNVKGDNGFTSEENGSKIWDARGEDIYYTGEISKELPITVSVKYFLDGRELSPDEIKGKSGKAAIRFEYANNLYETVKTNGRDEKIYVPFAVLTGAMLDNDVFRNVKVSNGKIINDGDKTIAVGAAFPGMQSNLGIDSGKLEIPDYFEITADVNNFKMSETVTLAANEIFNNIDLEGIGSLDELEEALKTLSDAADQLSEGSDKLYDGLDELLEKSSQLVEGIDKLADGAYALKDGTADLAEGSSRLSEGAGRLSEGAEQLSAGSKQISDGSNELSYGLDTLSQNSASLREGSGQVFDTLLSAASDQLREAGISVPDLTAENYSQVLGQLLSSLEEASVNASSKGADETKAAEAAKESVIALMERLDDYNEFYTGLKQYTDGVDRAAQGASRLKEGAASLNDGANALNGGVGDLKDGSDSLKDGALRLNEGARQLYEGLLTLKNGAPALLEGITQLKDGAKELSEGMREFKEQGIQKLIDAVDGDLSGLVDRLKAAVEVSEGYNSFSGISEDMEGSVKFIFRTDGIF